MIQVIDSIPWVRCASGNVLSNHSNIQKVERWNFCDGLIYHPQQQNVAITAMFISLYCDIYERHWKCRVIKSILLSLHFKIQNRVLKINQSTPFSKLPQHYSGQLTQSIKLMQQINKSIIDTMFNMGIFLGQNTNVTLVNQDHNYSTNATGDHAIWCNNIQYSAITYNTMHVGAYSCLQNRIFLAGQLSSDIFSLPYSLLLDYSVLSSLPYPTLPEIEKPLLFRACSSPIIHCYLQGPRHWGVGIIVNISLHCREQHSNPRHSQLQSRHCFCGHPIQFQSSSCS